VPERAPWLAQYLHELTAFPNAKHDDQADSTAQMLDCFKEPAANPAVSTVTIGRSPKNFTTRRPSNPHRYRRAASAGGDTEQRCVSLVTATNDASPAAQCLILTLKTTSRRGRE
jgi:hypothetical protein